MANIYEPQEDSRLLQKVLKEILQEWKAKKKTSPFVLDMGTGTGILAKTALEEGCTVIAVDKNPQALAYCQKHYQSWIQQKKLFLRESDLFSALPETFDIIVCNPPYLPNEPNDPDMALDGGTCGYEWTLQFLKKAKKHLTSKGKLLVLLSSRSQPEVILKEAQRLAYRFEKKDQADFFFEHLFVYLFEKKER